METFVLSEINIVNLINKVTNSKDKLNIQIDLINFNPTLVSSLISTYLNSFRYKTINIKTMPNETTEDKEIYLERYDFTRIQLKTGKTRLSTFVFDPRTEKESYTGSLAPNDILHLKDKEMLFINELRTIRFKFH